ncbi:hypothetical protein D3Z51_15250, partial [Clostridiaceae bacterium]|nr:hypothetical protein [Clostridiaceae bacterium]
ILHRKPELKKKRQPPPIRRLVVYSLTSSPAHIAWGMRFQTVKKGSAKAGFFDIIKSEVRIC